MARIIDCSMIVSNKTWRGPWKASIGTNQYEPIEIEGVKLRGQRHRLDIPRAG